MSSTIIALDRVTRIYGQFAALRDVSLQIEAGSSTMLVGENGAGKSTLLRLIAGLGSPSYGIISVFGQAPLSVRHRVAYMSHAPMLYEELTALENLRYFATLAAPSHAADPAAMLKLVGLDPDLPRRVSEYSQGMRQRASLARALLCSPELLLLDEPFSNLDAAGAGAMIELLQKFVNTPTNDGSPRTLLFTTHQRELAAPLATAFLRLQNGRLIT